MDTPLREVIVNVGLLLTGFGAVVGWLVIGWLAWHALQVAL